jgi:hypothetical protein
MSFDADPRTDRPEQKPVGSLLSDVVNQLTRLVRGEIALAKAEVAQNLRNAGIGIGLLVGALVLALVALHVLAAALVAAIAALGLGPGWAALIVGVVLLVVALVLALRGASALKPENLAPSRTVRNVQADAQTIKETISQ